MPLLDQVVLPFGQKPPDQMADDGEPQRQQQPRPFPLSQGRTEQAPIQGGDQPPDQADHKDRPPHPEPPVET